MINARIFMPPPQQCNGWTTGSIFNALDVTRALSLCAVRPDDSRSRGSCGARACAGCRRRIAPRPSATEGVVKRQLAPPAAWPGRRAWPCARMRRRPQTQRHAANQASRPGRAAGIVCNGRVTISFRQACRGDSVGGFWRRAPGGCARAGNRDAAWSRTIADSSAWRFAVQRGRIVEAARVAVK